MGDEAKLEPVKFDEFLKRVANKDARITLVDVWASWCLPCKENFPHLVEMNTRFAGKGLAVASLSFDDPAEPKQVKDAVEFLTAKKAAFPNYLLDEEQGVGYEKLNIGSIPAVFIYGPDGKELKRYTMDDPNNQFTYEEVEKDVVALLDGKPLPKEEKESARREVSDRKKKSRFPARPRSSGLLQSLGRTGRQPRLVFLKWRDDPPKPVEPA